jgi:hypothetical protein
LQSSLEEEHLQHPFIPAQSLILQSSLEEEEEQSCSILSTTKSRAAAASGLAVSNNSLLQSVCSNVWSCFAAAKARWKH